MKRLHNQVDLTASLADICVIQTRHDKQKKKAERREVLDLPPAAIVKFNAKGRDATKLNKNEIVAMLLNCYCVDKVAAWKKEKKGFFLEKLQNEISSDGTLIPAATAADRVIAKPPPNKAKPPPENAFLEKLENEISSDGTLTPAATAAGCVIAKPPPENAKLPPNKAKPPASNANYRRKHGDTEDKEPPNAKSKRRTLAFSGEESSDGGADDDDESDERKPEAMATQTKIIVLSDSDSD
jgi:hypothetical protein